MDSKWYHVCWPRVTAKRVEPVVSISWASCFYIHVTHLYHSSLTQSLYAAIRIRHETVYVALSPVNYNHDISALQSCRTSLQAWFCKSGMALDQSKSVAILFGTPQRLKSVSDLKCITVTNTAILFSGIKNSWCYARFQSYNRTSY